MGRSTTPRSPILRAQLMMPSSAKSRAGRRCSVASTFPCRSDATKCFGMLALAVFGTDCPLLASGISRRICTVVLASISALSPSSHWGVATLRRFYVIALRRNNYTALIKLALLS